MSILITGMEMPQSCVLCRMSEYHVTSPYCKITEAKILRNRDRNNDCPLVPVPAHGDLIDRDKFRSTVFIGEQWLYSWDELEDAIDYASTIIPAEPAEEGE